MIMSNYNTANELKITEFGEYLAFKSMVPERSSYIQQIRINRGNNKHF